MGSIGGIYGVNRGGYVGSIGEYLGSIGGKYGVHRGKIWGP